MKRTAHRRLPPRPTDGHQTLSSLHPGSLRRVLALAEGRRAVHRRPSRRGRLPDRGGARAPREHLELDRRALLAGARLRGLPRAPGGRPRGIPPPPRRAARRAGAARRRCSRSTTPSSRRRSAPTTSTSRRPRARSRARTSRRRSTRSSAPSKILIAGTDQMAFFASYLRHLLMLLDLRAETVASPSQEALGRLARIDERTLVIGLSAGRPHPLVVRADEARAPPPGDDAGDHRRDALRGGQAGQHPALLLAQLARPTCARTRRCSALIQALAYGVYSRDAAQYDDASRPSG